MNSKKVNYILLILISLFIVSLLFRLTKLIFDPLLLRDSAIYIRIARIWADNGGTLQSITKEIIVPPIPIYMIKRLMLFGFNEETAGRTISLFLNSMIPVIGFLIAQELFKSIKTSLVCAAILMIHPTLIEYSIQPIRENCYLFFFGVAVYAFIKGVQSGKAKGWICCGLFSSLAFFSRYEAIELMAILPVIFSILVLKKKIHFSSALRHFSIYAITILASTLFMLSLTGYDASFLLKLSYYTNKSFHSIEHVEDITTFFEGDK